jgi:hypothetical protein
MDKRRKGAAAPLDFTSELKESIGARLSDADAVKYEPPIVA